MIAAAAALEGLPVCMRILKWSQVTDRRAKGDCDQHDPAGIRREVVMGTDSHNRVTGLWTISGGAPRLPSLLKHLLATSPASGLCSRCCQNPSSPSQPHLLLQSVWELCLPGAVCQSSSDRDAFADPSLSHYSCQLIK